MSLQFFWNDTEVVPYGFQVNIAIGEIAHSERSRPGICFEIPLPACFLIWFKDQRNFAIVNPEDDEFGDLGTQDEARFKLNQVIYREGQRFRYEYDFGDSWTHTMVMEKIFPD